MTHGLPEHVAREVRAEMARQRVTQRYVARVLGISQPQVAARLQGRVEFRTSELDLLAKALHVPVTHFLPPRAAAA